jgi:hypothetical protein
VKLQGDAGQIAQLVAQIQADPLFQTITPAQRKMAVKGEWRLGLQWNHLAVRAGFVEDYFRLIYNLLCGRSHSDYLSVIQFRDATTLETQRQLARVYVQFGLVLMGYFTRTYASVAPKGNEVLEQFPEAARKARMWYEIGCEFGREIAAARQKKASKGD